MKFIAVPSIVGCCKHRKKYFFLISKMYTYIPSKKSQSHALNKSTTCIKESQFE